MKKSEVAEFLGVSEKTVQNKVKAGRLTVRYEPGATSSIGVYDRGEVEAEKARMETENTPRPKVEREKPERGSSENNGVGEKAPNLETALAVPASPFRVPASGPVLSIQVADLPALAQAMVQTLDAGRAEQGITLQELAVKPLLSASEINTLYGVPEREVRQGMKDGGLRSAKVGRSQKARRADVDAWVNQRFDS